MSGVDLVLIDGSSYLYRAFHALPNLTNSSGEPTGALHGVLTMINKLVREQPDAHVGIVFDAPGKTFRDDIYKEYKATRPPMPDELRSQVQPILDAVKLMGLPLLQIEGVEADDVIGTLALEGEKAGFDVYIVTGDKDFMQLVSDKVQLYNVFKPNVDLVIEGVDAVADKFQTTPDRVVDVLAIMGDSSDNVPGVKGIGEKGAAKLIREYGTLDRLLAEAEQVKAKRAREGLIGQADEARLSRELSTLRSDVPLDGGWKALERAEPDVTALRALIEAFDQERLDQARALLDLIPTDKQAAP